MKADHIIRLECTDGMSRWEFMKKMGPRRSGGRRGVLAHRTVAIGGGFDRLRVSFY